MLVFVVPVKAREQTRSWERFSALTERTLRSICRQTSLAFRVIVVHSDLPVIDFSHPAIEFLAVEALPVEATVGAIDADKTNRVLRALEHVRAAEPQGRTFVMPVDSDDLVSRRLAGFVEAHPEEPGWLFRKGYVLAEGRKVAYLNVRNFNHSCGTSAIFDLDHAGELIFDHERDGRGDCYTRYNFERPRIALPPLPFCGSIYSILNGENTFLDASRIDQHRGLEARPIYYLRKATKYIPVPVRASMREEFGL